MNAGGAKQMARVPGSGLTTNADIELAWEQLVQHHLCAMALQGNVRADGRGLLDSRPLQLEVPPPVACTWCHCTWSVAHPIVPCMVTTSALPVIAIRSGVDRLWPHTCMHHCTTGADDSFFEQRVWGMPG